MSHMKLSKRISRVNKFIHLYEPQDIAYNFRNMHNIITSRTIHKSTETFDFGIRDIQFPETFPYKNQDININDFLIENCTTGFIVIKDDQILRENYWLGNEKKSLCISWSMGKSIVSAMIGIAIDQGYIESVGAIVSDIVPELKAGGYNGVTLKQVLQMSSGVRFDEDYEKFFSDINKMGRRIAFGLSLNHLATHLHSQREPGTYNHYVSMDTQVLGMVLKAATGKNLSQYLEETIWSKIGTEYDAKWLIDNKGVEMAFGTINATLRDYARFGRLFANWGNWNGEQVVPKQWIIDSITPDGPHLQPGLNDLSDYELGYGYQWWLPAEPDGDFMALGYKGQSIYINPSANLIIARTAADPNWTTDSESSPMMTALSQYLAKELVLSSTK